jgi:hypothetical protein
VGGPRESVQEEVVCGKCGQRRRIRTVLTDDKAGIGYLPAVPRLARCTVERLMGELGLAGRHPRQVQTHHAGGSGGSASGGSCPTPVRPTGTESALGRRPHLCLYLVGFRLRGVRGRCLRIAGSWVGGWHQRWRPRWCSMRSSRPSGRVDKKVFSISKMLSTTQIGDLRVVSRGGRNTSLDSGGCVVIVASREEGPGLPAPIGQAAAVYRATCPRLVHRRRGEVRVSRTSANNWARGYKTYRRGEAVGFVPALDRLTVRQISNRYLSEEERLDIADLRRSGLNIRGITAELGRAPSTISWELRRNSRRDGTYRPFEAHRWAVHRRARRHRRRIDTKPALCELIAELLAQRWSAQQIARHLRGKYPTISRCGCAAKVSIKPSISPNHA